MDRRLFLTLLLPSTAAAAWRYQLPEPQSLSKLLESTYWAPGTTKTLLVIGGRQANPLPETIFGSDESSYRDYYSALRRKTMAQLGPAPPRGYALAAVAACYGRKVVRFGQVSAVVTQYRKTLNLTPGPPLPEPKASEGSIKLLIDALDDAGIKKLLSESGIGRSDIPRSSLPLFDAIQPGPLWVRRGDQDKPVLALTAEQLPALRLRVSLASSLRAFKDEEPAVYLNKWEQNNLNRAQAPDYVSKPLSRAPRENLLIRSVPAQPLPSDLATETLSRRISLEGIGYLGKLAEQVGKAEGITLVVPRMLENLSVDFRGDPEVRTDDVVRAITASVTGTFRECTGSFVLTDNLTPLGPRLEKLNRWLEQGDALYREPKSLPVEWGRFDVNDTYPIPKALQERLVESDEIIFPLAEFPDQKLLGRLLASYRFAPSHVSLSMYWRAYLLVPNLGPVYLESLSIDQSKRPTRRRSPLTLRGTWPILRLTDLKEVKDAVAWTTEQGALGIVIDGSLEVVQAAIQERHLPVRALYHPWQALPGDPDDLKERTIEKVIVDYLSPTHPNTFERVAERLKRYVTLSGLNGLLLRDATPPGYQFVADQPNPMTLLGYTERNRQDFLRESKQDIFDIPPGHCAYALSCYTPWVEVYGEAEWGMWRVKQLFESLNRLRKAISTSCPIWLEGGLKPTSYLKEALGDPLPGWLVPWDIWKEDDEHWLWDLYYPSEQKLIVTARKAGPNPWLLIPIPKGSKRASVEERLGKLEQERGEGWQGQYLDLSEHSLSEAQELLSRV